MVVFNFALISCILLLPRTTVRPMYATCASLAMRGKGVTAGDANIHRLQFRSRLDKALEVLRPVGPLMGEIAKAKSSLQEAKLC